MWLRNQGGKRAGRAGAFIVAGILIIAAGCSVGPNYVRPPVATPPAYKEDTCVTGDVCWNTAQPRDELPRGKWWLIYNDPQLNALEDQVDISNQTLAQAEANYRQALAQIRVARAAYLPTITGGPAWMRFRNSANLGSGSRAAATAGTVSSTATSGVPGVSGGSAGGGGFGALGGTTVTNFLMNFNLSWEMDIWGLVRRSVEAAKATATAGAANVENARLSAQATLAQSYFELRILDEQKRIQDDIVNDFSKVLGYTKNRYAAGVAQKNDIALAETQLKNNQATAIDLGVQRAQLEHAIATLIGKPAPSFAIPRIQLCQKVPSIPVGVPSQLLERRPDIAAAERQMAAANAQIGVAIAAFFPNLTLSSAGGFQASNAAMWFLWPSRFWSLGASTSQSNIFAGMKNIGLTQSARAAYDAAVANYRQTVLTGFQEVEDNLAALCILRDEAAVQDQAVAAAKLSVELSTNQYKAGTLNTIDLLAVITTYRNNQRQAATIWGNRLSASALLIKGLGGGWNAADLPILAPPPPWPKPYQPDLTESPPETAVPAAVPAR